MQVSKEYIKKDNTCLKSIILPFIFKLSQGTISHSWLMFFLIIITILLVSSLRLRELP